MSEKKRIGGGGSQSGEPSKPLKAEGSSKKGVQQRSQKTAAPKKRPQQKPTHPPVTVRRIHGDTKGKELSPSLPTLFHGNNHIETWAFQAETA